MISSNFDPPPRIESAPYRVRQFVGDPQLCQFAQTVHLSLRHALQGTFLPPGGLRLVVSFDRAQVCGGRVELVGTTTEGLRVNLRWVEELT